MKLADRMETRPTRAAPSTDAEPVPADLPSLGDVMARIAAEVSVPLTTALDRVLSLARSGHIDRAGLQSLRDEIDGARRVGLRGQQIARIASGEVKPAIERIDLARLLSEVLTDRATRAASRAVDSRQSLAAAEVMGDASLMHALLQAAADWSAGLARAAVEWQLDLKPWPVRARVQCRFPHGAADRSAAQADPPDTLDWLLLQYIAHIAGVIVQRDDGASHTTLVLEFVSTVSNTLEGASAIELDADSTAAPLAPGSQVLVLAARPDTRAQVRAALPGHDLIIDHVPTVAAACQYCEDGVPQVLLFEASFGGAPLRALCDQLQAVSPGVALIEIVPSWQGCEMGDSTGDRLTRVGAEGMRQMLPSVVLLELARQR